MVTVTIPDSIYYLWNQIPPKSIILSIETFDSFTNLMVPFCWTVYKIRFIRFHIADNSLSVITTNDFNVIQTHCHGLLSENICYYTSCNTIVL